MLISAQKILIAAYEVLACFKKVNDCQVQQSYSHRVTESVLLVVPIRLLAAHLYSPPSAGAKLRIDSGGLSLVPPEYLELPEITRTVSFLYQVTDVNAGDSCVTITVQDMVTVEPDSIDALDTTVGLTEMK